MILSLCNRTLHILNYNIIIISYLHLVIILFIIYILLFLAFFIQQRLIIIEHLILNLFLLDKLLLNRLLLPWFRLVNLLIGLIAFQLFSSRLIPNRKHDLVNSPLKPSVQFLLRVVSTPEFQHQHCLHPIQLLMQVRVTRVE
jgi:hypothetical protein